VEVAGDVRVGGAIARVGQRLLGGVSRMMMDRFFGCLQQKAAAPGQS
jgi:carbon monoxide dehydrogenase subunit G